MPEAKCRILCVDDHEDSSELLRLLLTEADNEVHIAHTMVEAIQLAKAHEFDLYVIDKHLPDGSGVELCRILGGLTPGVPCIFYTGDTYDVHRQEALAAGADAVISKPDIDELIATVEKILSERECATAT